MEKYNEFNWLSVLGYFIASTVAFFVGGIVASYTVEFIFLGTLLAGAVSGVLLALFTRQFRKVGRITMAAAIAVSVGFWGTFMIGEGLFYLIELVVDLGRLENILVFILMGVAFGGIFSAILYGKKAIILFMIVCGIVEVPCLYIAENLYRNEYITDTMKDYGIVDLNMLFFVIGFGVGAGISMGLLPKFVNTIDKVNDNET